MRNFTENFASQNQLSWTGSPMTEIKTEKSGIQA